MQIHRKKRLAWIITLILAASVAIALVIYAMGQNINVYYTPSQLQDNPQAKSLKLRIGGMVKPESIQHAEEGLTVNFIVTDYKHEVPVVYTGVLPALFREGQGIVVQGQFQSNVFKANEVLAKHDENYMPPMVEAQKP